jgi:flagellar hook-length control protein FliK
MASIPSEHSVSGSSAAANRSARKASALEGPLSPFSQLLASTAATLRVAAQQTPPPPAAPPATKSPAAAHEPAAPAAAARQDENEQQSDDEPVKTDETPARPADAEAGPSSTVSDQQPTVDDEGTSEPSQDGEPDDEESQSELVTGQGTASPTPAQPIVVLDVDVAAKTALVPELAADADGDGNQADPSAQTLAADAEEAVSVASGDEAELELLEQAAGRRLTPQETTRKSASSTAELAAANQERRAGKHRGEPVDQDVRGDRPANAGGDERPTEKVSDPQLTLLDDQAPLETRDVPVRRGAAEQVKVKLEPSATTAATTSVASPTSEMTATTSRASAAASEADAPRTTEAAPIGGGTANSRLPEQLLARGTRRTPETTELNPAEQNRFVQRVARAIDAARQRDGEVRLRLSPPELGSLRLEVRMQHGALTARLEAETPAARALLIDGLPALRDRLADQGIRIDQFDVDLLDRRDQPAPDHGDQQAQQESAPHRQAAALRRNDAARSEEVESQPLSQPLAGRNQQINIIV